MLNYYLRITVVNSKVKQEAQGLGALLDKMEDNDLINWITQRSRCIFHSKIPPFSRHKVFENQKYTV